MAVTGHSSFREGAIAGVLGGLAMALWYLVVDSLSGRPFHTPNVLGRAVFGQDATTATAVDWGAVAGYTLVHFALFIAVGMLLTKLVHLATQALILRMGLWIGLLIAFLYFNGHMYMFSRASGQAFGWWAILGGSFLAVVAIAVYLWRRHPALGHSLRHVGIGDAEARNPPAPPGGPRV